MGIMYKLMKHRTLTMDLTTKPTAKAKTKSDKCRLLTVDGQHIESPPLSVGQKVNDLLPHNQNRQIKVQEMAEMEEDDTDKRFTAEHILQLCKFLAEKSKGNKNLYKQQQSPKKFTKSTKHFQFQSMDYKTAAYADNIKYDNDDSGDSDDNCPDDDDGINSKVYDNDNHHDVFNGLLQNEAMPLLSNLRHRRKNDDEDIQMTTNVLSSRLSPDINALNISSTSSSSPPTAITMSVTAVLQRQNNGGHQQHEQQQQLLKRQQEIQPPQQHGKRDILLKIRHQIFERKRMREKGFEPQAIHVNSQVWRPW